MAGRPRHCVDLAQPGHRGGDLAAPGSTLTPPAAAWLARAGLAQQWVHRERFTVLDTHFGGGERFLACWQAWRRGRDQTPAGGAWPQLHVLAIVPCLATALQSSGPMTTDGAALFDALALAWPLPTPDWHRLAFDGGGVHLLLVPGGVRAALPQLRIKADAFFVDTATLNDEGDRQWPQRLFKALARLAAPDASVTLPAGFERHHNACKAAGFETSPEATAPDGLSNARYAPRFTPRAPARALANASANASAATVACGERYALIVGAGLAGCAVAWALSEAGWRSTVFDRQPAPAREASGNPAGLFHGIVNPQDGLHARFNRCAALHAHHAVQQAIEHHGVPGHAGGLLRLETSGLSAAAMQAQLQTLQLPAGYVQAVPATQASALAGICLTHPCWYYPGGGWVQPAGLARAFLARGGGRVSLRPGAGVEAVRRTADGTRWQLIDAEGTVLDEAATVVLAHAGDAATLLNHETCLATPLPLQQVRGQLSVLPPAAWAAACPGRALPLLPVAGAGYLLPAIDGCAVFGATSQIDDHDPQVRLGDHRLNLQALGRLTGKAFDDAALAAAALTAQGRTAWRCVAGDRLPLIGAVPAQSRAPFADRLQAVPRLPGLFTFTALGSRGITWAALGGQTLTAAIAGTPSPLSARLLDAVDPARFMLRQQRHS